MGIVAFLTIRAPRYVPKPTYFPWTAQKSKDHFYTWVSTLVKKHACYCGSAKKCHLTPCFAIFFSAMLCNAIFWSAESINYGHSALHGHWATFSSAEKCQFMPFMAIFSVLKESIFFPRATFGKYTKSHIKYACAHNSWCGGFTIRFPLSLPALNKFSIDFTSEPRLRELLVAGELILFDPFEDE